MSKRGNEAGASNSLKLDKSATRMAQRGGYAKMRNHERLSGGADAKSKSSVSTSKSAGDASAKVTAVISEVTKATPEAEEEIESILEKSNANEDEEGEGTGDKRVNEMIDYVIHNLQEAGKALASLEDNFEGDLKLMFEEIMRKVKNWMSEAQSRLDTANENLDKLRRAFTSRSTEIASRDREIADLREKLDEMRASNVAAAEKDLEENIQKSPETIEPSGKSSAPSHQPSSTAAHSTHSVDTRYVAQSDAQLAAESGPQLGDRTVAEIGPTSGAQISAPSDTQMSPTSGAQMSTTSGAQISPTSGAQISPTAGAQMSTTSGAQMSTTSGVEMSPTSGAEMSTTSGAQMNAPSGAQMSPTSGAELVAPSDAQFSTEPGAQKRASFDAEIAIPSDAESVDESGARSRLADPEASKQPTSGADDRIGPGATASGVTVKKSFAVPSTLDERNYEKIARGENSQEISGIRGEMSVDPRPKASSVTVEKSHGVSTRVERSQGRFSRGQSQQSTRPANLSHSRTDTADAAVQSGKSKERVKRMSDLESELSRLKKENERIVKEKVDYENAIQRALLRGVSSLNAETLKVLKVSPVACYTPCPSSVSPTDTTETLTPGAQKSTRDNWTPRGCRTSVNASQSTQGSVRNKSNVESHPERPSICCNARISLNGTQKTGSKQKKSPATSDSSMVFLLHQADASSICVSNNASKVRPCGRGKTKKLENSVCVKKLG